MSDMVFIDFPAEEPGEGFGSHDPPEDSVEWALHMLRQRSCPAGEPHTGDDPTADHGHSDCYAMGLGVRRIEELQARVAELEQTVANTWTVIDQLVGIPLAPGLTADEILVKYHTHLHPTPEPGCELCGTT